MLQTQPITQRVFIVGDNTLFEECIQHLLAHGTGLQVTSIKYTDELTLLDRIAIYRPQAIILNESSLLVPVSFIELLFATYLAIAIRLIIVRDTDCVMDVYDISDQMKVRKPCKPQQFMLSTQNDLLTVIKD